MTDKREPVTDAAEEVRERLMPPMVVVTRPQDWAPAARAILWPELSGVAERMRVER